MKESSSHMNENPFELINYDGILTPRILTHPDRLKDFEEYKRGWNDQSKNTAEQIIPTHKNTDIRGADDWYKAGAAYRYRQFSDRITKGTCSQEHEKELDHVMQSIRSNSMLIPSDAWPSDEKEDDKPDSDSPRFG